MAFQSISVSSLLTAAVVLATAVFVQAEYPASEFVWGEGDDCPPGYDYCGMLEFCTGEDFLSYGYRLPCEEAECPCVGVSGPLIRLQPGKKYFFTLRNAAEREWIVTNIHTHGLHIVGDGDSDDVVREASGGGNCLDYTWDIADDHPGGTYWYHAHHHGYTEEQVAGGAYGMLIVEDNIMLNPVLPSWASNELLLQIVVTWNGILGNGKADEVIPIDANQWYRLRVSVVAAESQMEDLVFQGGDCDVHLAASDGIWRSLVPGPKNNTFGLTGASRADFAIRCSSSNDTATISYYGATVATLDIGEEESSPFQLGNWTPDRPLSLDFALTTAVPDENKFSLQLSYDSVNGRGWDPDVALARIAYDEVHEWTLKATAAHPFHLHLYHMRIATPGGCGSHEEGEFYDTIAATGDCTVRFKAADFGQRCVLHCHILMHEDNGSMGWVDVQGPGMPLNLVESPAYQCPVGPTVAPSPAPVSAAPTSSPPDSLTTPPISTTAPSISGAICVLPGMLASLVVFLSGVLVEL